MFLKFKNNTNFIETVKKISSVKGQRVITDHSVQNGFSKFCSGDISLRNDEEALRELVECNPRHIRQCNPSRKGRVEEVCSYLGIFKSLQIDIPTSMPLDY